MSHSFWTGFIILTLSLPLWSAEPLPKELEGVTLSEHLGTFLDLDLTFSTSEGKTVPLKTFFYDDKPVLLTLNYYECPSLCTLQLNALVDGLKALPWKPGETFRLLTLSINHREQPTLAQAKRQAYLTLLGKGEVDWNFLVGSQENIQKLAAALGFSFKYDPVQNQFAHPAAIFFITPDGKVARYLYGITYPTQNLKFALLETSAGHLGSPIDKILLSCFHYDPSLGRYGPFALGMMRVGGIITLFLLSGWLLYLWRKERGRRFIPSTPLKGAP